MATMDDHADNNQHQPRIPADLKSISFVDKAHEYQLKYPRHFIRTAPLFRWLVQFPDGATRRYVTALELKSDIGLGRAAFENLASGILPQHGKSECFPEIFPIFQTWDGFELPDSSVARQRYREYAARNVSDGNMGAQWWEDLFNDAREVASDAARRYPRSVRGDEVRK
jgi:hypothetical protein